MTAAEFASLSELLTLTLSPNTFRDVPVAISMGKLIDEQGTPGTDHLSLE